VEKLSHADDDNHADDRGGRPSGSEEHARRRGAALLSRLRRFMPAGPVDRSVRKAFALI